MAENGKKGLLGIGRLGTLFAKNKRWGNIILCAGLAGMVLIVLSYMLSDDAKKSKSKTASAEASQQTLISSDEYVKKLEEKLGKIVSGITGSENVTVMVTLQSGAEYIYANDLKSNTEETASGQNTTARRDAAEENYILIDTPEGGQAALLITELAPTVKGVVVVCDGGDDAKVKEKISAAVTTALDITSKRVCVTGR